MLAGTSGLLVNGVLKEHWGRPRTIDVAQFGGIEHFVAWWDPRGDCPKNCSIHVAASALASEQQPSRCRRSREPETRSLQYPNRSWKFTCGWLPQCGALRQNHSIALRCRERAPSTSSNRPHALHMIFEISAERRREDRDERAVTRPRAAAPMVLSETPFAPPR
jgi:hypothetical protein